MISGVPSSTSVMLLGHFCRVLQAPHDLVSGEVFNVGSYKLNYSLGQVAEKIQEQIPELVIEHKENLDKRNYRVSFDKIHSYLGFVCTTGLEDGVEEIKKTIESGLVKNYRDSIFSNYEHLWARTAICSSVIQVFNSSLFWNLSMRPIQPRR